MTKSLTPERRSQLAESFESSGATLYQAMTGRKTPYSPEKCVSIERKTNGELRRWDLRPRDWHLIWPELIGTPGAPEPQQKEAA